MLDLDSTLVRRGTNAATLTEMAEFADMLQDRKVDKLLAELPAIAELSESKFSLARQIIRRRARTLTRPDYEQLRALAFEVAEGAGGSVGERIRSMFSFA
jgi:hypothetical protein